MIASAERREDKPCLDNEGSSFVTRVDGHAQDTQIVNLAYVITNITRHRERNRPRLVLQKENQLPGVSCIGDLLVELPIGPNHYGSDAWHNDFSRSE